VLTGAGMSAESGLPTFRDAHGLWHGERPEDVATPQAFRRDPVRVWRWYAERRADMATAAPNAGHLALAALQGLVPDVTVVTQNIDGLHRRAGSSRQRVRSMGVPLRSQFPNGIVSSLSFVSTTNTARSLAGCVSLALALTPWRSPGSSEKLCPAS
jgi:hypothetical protein